MELEYKSVPFEVKEITDQGIVKGYAAAIGNVDDGGDKILSGAMDKSIARSKGVVPMFWSHDWSAIPLGYGTNAQTDQKGLAVEGQLTLSIPAVKDAYESLKHAKEVGFKMGMSIGYRTMPKGYEFEQDTNVRLLKEIDIFEWSITPFPMNRKATVSAVKSLDIESLTERQFEEFLRDAGFSATKAKTIISRGFKALKNDQRDAASGDEQAADLIRQLQFNAGLAELRTLITR